MTGHLNDNDGIAWTIDRSTSDIPSLLLSGQRLYYMNTNSGVISCANATTGEHYFQSKRLPDIDNVYSSPVAANGYVFVTGRDGHTVVLRDSEDFEVVATNAVDDHVDASVAIVNDEILLRGSQRLYCIAE
jgi:outer membrane protein assembly factor BamB